MFNRLCTCRCALARVLHDAEYCSSLFRLSNEKFIEAMAILERFAAAVPSIEPSAISSVQPSQTIDAGRTEESCESTLPISSAPSSPEGPQRITRSPKLLTRSPAHSRTGVEQSVGDAELQQQTVAVNLAWGKAFCRHARAKEEIGEVRWVEVVSLCL